MSRYGNLIIILYKAPHNSFNATAEARSWEWGTNPQKISSGWPCSKFFALPNFDLKLCDFQDWRILSLISNPAFVALHSQNMIRAATQENAFGLCVAQSVLLKWDCLKHTVYIQCITPRFTVPDKKVQLYRL